MPPRRNSPDVFLPLTLLARRGLLASAWGTLLAACSAEPAGGSAAFRGESADQGGGLIPAADAPMVDLRTSPSTVSPGTEGGTSWFAVVEPRRGEAALAVPSAVSPPLSVTVLGARSAVPVDVGGPFRPATACDSKLYRLPVDALGGVIATTGDPSSQPPVETIRGAAIEDRAASSLGGVGMGYLSPRVEGGGPPPAPLRVVPEEVVRLPSGFGDAALFAHGTVGPLLVLGMLDASGGRTVAGWASDRLPAPPPFGVLPPSDRDGDGQAEVVISSGTGDPARHMFRVVLALRPAGGGWRFEEAWRAGWDPDCCGPASNCPDAPP